MVPENVANVKSQAADFKPLPQGVYEAQVLDITFKPKEENTASKYKPIDKFWILLGILNGEHRGETLMHFVSTSFNAGYSGGQSSKLYDFSEAVMNQKVDDKEGIDVNTLVGGALQIVVKHTVTPDRTFANITEVMAVEKGKEVKDFTIEEMDAILKPRAEYADKEGKEGIDPDDLDIDKLKDLNK